MKAGDRSRSGTVDRGGQILAHQARCSVDDICSHCAVDICWRQTGGTGGRHTSLKACDCNRGRTIN